MVNNYNLTVKRNENIGSFLLLILLGIAVSNVSSLGIYILLTVGVLFIAIKYYQIKFPVDACVLFLFAYLFFVFSFSHTGILSAVKIFVCPLIWLVGYNMSEARTMHGILRVVTVLAYGMAVHALLNYFYNILLGTDLYTGQSNDIWTGELSAATGQAVNYAIFLAIAFWLIFLQKKKYLRIISVGALICCVMHIIQLGSRTSMVLLIISFALNMLVLLFRKRKLKQIVTVLFAMAASAAIIYLVYSRNIMDIRTYIENSYLFRRIERSGAAFFLLAKNSRFIYKVEYFREMPNNLWGGGNLRNSVVGFYAHDLWLDVFDDAGILAFLALCVYSILAISRLIRVQKNYRGTNEESLLWLSYTTVIIAQFCVEPIWQGAPLLFCAFVMIDGMLTRYLKGSVNGKLISV